MALGQGGPATAQFLGYYEPGETLKFSVQCVDSSGQAVDLASPPTYEILEEDDLAGASKATGTMALVTSAQVLDGLYSEAVSLGGSFAVDKNYIVHIEWTENANQFVALYRFYTRGLAKQSEMNVVNKAVLGTDTPAANNTRIARKSEVSR